MKKVGTTAMVCAVLLVVASGCRPNPADCYDKGDEKACNALCETGKQEFTPTCFEMRARNVLACADGAGDCAKACEAWKNAAGSDTEKIYMAKLGTDVKVSAFKKKCGAK